MMMAENMIWSTHTIATVNIYSGDGVGGPDHVLCHHHSVCTLHHSASAVPAIYRSGVPALAENLAGQERVHPGELYKVFPQDHASHLSCTGYIIHSIASNLFLRCCHFPIMGLFSKQLFQ